MTSETVISLPTFPGFGLRDQILRVTTPGVNPPFCEFVNREGKAVKNFFDKDELTKIHNERDTRTRPA